MAVVAMFAFPWSTPLVAPQGQAVTFLTSAAYISPIVMNNVIPAPYVYNLVPPPTPVEAEILALNDSVVQVLSL